ncbi:MAG: SCP2 sterol-binding domain-containing protein [archaeon]|nr:SCP2 sterol-binding domain-containing protein [archaeon]
MFQTQEWADKFKNSLNNNPNYRESIETWEGAIILLFLAEKIRINEDVRVYMDIYHGEVRGVRFLEKGEEIEHEFVFKAKESVWDDLVQERVIPSKLLMTGKFKIEGDMKIINRSMRPAGYIMKYIKRLLKDW